MRPRVALLGVVGMSSLLLGLAPTTAVAKAGTPVTLYAYEEIGPHSLLADPSAGVQYMDPVCSPDFTNCVTYEFDDLWDVAATPSETDDSNVFGYLENHGVDNFLRHTVKGTLTLTTGGVTWTGGYSGTFSGKKAATGTFSLLGTDGTKLTGTIAFLDDGLMGLSGTLR
jgi:hypothetical protein